jgi:hypothetical protein
MMAARHFFWGAALAAAFSVTLVAQQAPPEFNRVYCVKVKPGKAADMASTINGDLRKYSQSLADSGAISHWAALRAVAPTGTEAECDYRVVYFYPGLPTAPLSGDELTASLQKAGIEMNAQQFDEHLNDVGTLVYMSINEHAVAVGGDKEGDYVVINEMNVPDVGAWIANEKKLWQPIFEDGVKDGAVGGWSVGVEFMPRGSRDHHLAYTADIYPDWQAVFNFFGPTFSDRWKKVHPDVPISEGMAQEHKMDTIIHTSLFQVVAAVHAAK